MIITQRWRQLLMPGSRNLLMGCGEGRYQVLLKVHPNSWLRYIPLFGQLRLFRMGALVSFKFHITTVEVNESLPEVNDGKQSERIILLANGMPHNTIWLEFTIPNKVGGKTTATTDSFFLEFTGDAQLRIRSGSYAADTCYTFQVQEPAMAVVNWTIGLLAGVAGGLIVWLIGVLTGNDVTPPSGPTGGSR